MIHALLIFVFTCVVTIWLLFEFPKRKVAWRPQWPWLIAAICLPILGSILSLHYGGKVGNFLLHSIGGGLAPACIFRYLTATLGWSLNWRFSLVGTFMLASSLGVINELAEFGAELLLIGTFSFDSQDTWRDLAANTLGAVVGWVIIGLVMTSSKKRSG